MKTLLFLSTLVCFFVASAKEKKLILHLNGKVQYEFEKDGLMLDGRFSCYYESGKLRIKGQFKANQKTGQWRYWDEKGILRSERNYTNNEEFVIVHEYDSAGIKIKSSLSPKSMAGDCDSRDYFFAHKYISSISRQDAVNSELFEENGIVHLLLQDVVAGSGILFNDDSFSETIQTGTLAVTDYTRVVSLLVKENYHWCSREQNLNNEVLGLCPVVIENGQPKELGWFYVPQSLLVPSLLKKIKDHAYASVVTRTTATDTGFRLQQVHPGENDLVRFMLIELEANAILYKIDNDQSLAVSQ